MRPYLEGQLSCTALKLEIRFCCGLADKGGENNLGISFSSLSQNGLRPLAEDADAE